MGRSAPLQDVDGGYLEETLRYEPIEPSLEDTVSLKTLAYLAVRASIAASVFLTLFVTLWVITGGLSSVASPTGTGNTGLLAVAVFTSFAAFWVALLFSPVEEPIGEWRVMLADRWEYAGSVYSAVAGVLAARSLPVRPTARRIYADPAAREVKHMLEIKEGQYSVYVTVFPYGSSLYVGWMMWRRRTGAALVGRMFTELAGLMTSTADTTRVMLRTDRPRALREAVHAACREGVFSAVRQEMVADSFGFPNGLPPIEAYEVTAAAAPPVTTPPEPPVATAPPTPFGQAARAARRQSAPTEPSGDRGGSEG